MAKFFVGQRVRIKWSNTFPHLAGRAGVILGGAYPLRPGHDDPRCMWRVRPDGFESDLVPHAGSPTGCACFAPNEDQLEPATDSYDVTTWDSCVWRPEHLRVGV
jgi:hypothetical protein